MKKDLLKLIDIQLTRMKGVKKTNSLDGDAAALIDQTISDLEALRTDADASEDVIGVDSIVDRLRDIVDEKINAALEKVKDIDTTNSVKAANYLSSKNAVKDFCRVIRSSRSGEEFDTQWRQVLSTNGVMIEDNTGYIPTVVKSRIEDNWNSDTNWLRYLNNTGAKRFALRYTMADQDEASVRARGHQPGTKKSEQDVQLSTKTLTLQAVYKFQTLDNLTIYEDDGQLVDWIVDELTRQIYYEIARCILVGDGRNDNAHIDSIEAIYIDGRTTDAFVQVSNEASSGQLLADIMNNVIAPIYNGEDTLLFVSKEDLFEMRRSLFAAGGTVKYASIDELKDMLGVRDIIAVPYLGNARAIALHPQRYYTVGNMTNFDFVTFADHWMNTENYRAETFVGGGVGLNAAAVWAPMGE